MAGKTKNSNSKKILWTAKIILAVLLCWLVVRNVHLYDQPEPNSEPGLISLVRNACTNYALWFGVLLFPTAILLGAWRWQRLLRAGRVRLSYAKALMLTLMGNFFNNALPSMIGGDVVKLYYVMRSFPNRKSNVTVAWITDRVTGFAGLAMVCLAAIAVGWNNPLVEKIKWPIFTLAGLLTLLLAVLFVPGLARELHLTWLIGRLPFQGFVAQLRRAVRLYSAQPGTWIMALLVSVGIHMILLTCIYLGGRALAPGPSYHSYLVLLPPAWMLASIPITPGAVGWMEASYQTLFARAAVSGTAALSLSLFHRFLRLLWSLPGLIFYLKGPGFKSPETISVTTVDEILAVDSSTSPHTQPDHSGPADGF